MSRPSLFDSFPKTSTVTAAAALVAMVVAMVASSGTTYADSKAAPKGPEVITLVVVGDVGLNRSQLPVDSRGVVEGKGHLRWPEMTKGIRSLINGDLNFMNLETVVTDRNDLAPGDKGQKTPYLFRTHPKGVSHLIDVGFNLVSGANNHSYDYGEAGAIETVKHLRSLAKRKSFQFSGIGLDRKGAMAPAVFEHRGVGVAFSSIGIVTNMLKPHRATATKAGSMGYRYSEDWQAVAGALSEAKADLRLLSIHFGTERRIATEARQLDEWRWAAREKNVDVVIGHHAHVVRGVELHRGKLIFYGLGNFLIRGARDMGSSPKLATWGDYGLYAKVHLVRQPSGRYLTRAITVIPMTDMHRSPKPLPKAEAAKRIEVLNVLASKLDDRVNGSVGVRFRSQADGTGLHCVPGADRDPAPIASLCKAWKAPGAPSAEVRRIVLNKLGPGAKKKRTKPSQTKRRKSRRR